MNFRKNEFSKENQSLLLYWQKWGYTAKLAAIATVCIYLYAFLRDPLAQSIEDASTSLLRTKAVEAGLKKNQAGPTQVQKYVREKEREVKNKKILAELQDIDSAMLVMNRLSQLVPQKDRIALDIRRFNVVDDYLTLEGEVASRESLPPLQQAILSLSSDRHFQELAPSQKPQPGKTAFAYSVKINRRAGGAR